MNFYPTELENLIDFFKKLPGVGEKSAERHALAVLDMPLNYLEEVSKNFINAKTNSYNN